MKTILILAIALISITAFAQKPAKPVPKPDTIQVPTQTDTIKFTTYQLTKIQELRKAVTTSTAELKRYEFEVVDARVPVNTVLNHTIHETYIIVETPKQPASPPKRK